MKRHSGQIVKRRPSLLACLALAAVLLVVPARAGSGDLDLTFGAAGKVTTDFAFGRDFALGIAIQSDGKIVAAGNTSPVGDAGVDFALARYNPDGSLDATFGSGGEVVTDLGTRLDSAAAVAVRADGRIVAVGVSAPAGLSASDFALLGYNVDGELDPSFGSGGKVTTDFGGGEQGNAVTIQSDGKIVAAGGSSGDFALARYNPDGSLDPSFGSGGKVTTDLGSGDFAYELAIQSDGKIVVAGGGADFLLARYNADGGLDATFGSGGKVATDFGSGFDAAFGVAIQADGKIIAAGIGSGTFALARYDADGSLDPRFGSGGKVVADFGGFAANAVVLQADGKIVAAGGTGSGDFALVRYGPEGGLDASFGSAGRVTTDFASASESAFDLALQADGKIVAAGGTFGADFSNFALARYQSGGALTVSIDIKPGSAGNPVNLSGAGVLPVAVLTTGSFDATTLDPSTVCFGDDCTEAHGRGHLDDVNGDGQVDLVLHFEVGQTGIESGDSSVCLTGLTFGGAKVAGCDSITMP